MNQHTEKATGSQSRTEMVGVWQGVLKVGATELRMVVQIQTRADGSLTGTVDSPDQGATGIPISEVIFEDGRVRLVVQAVMGLFEGKLSEDGKQIVGEWRQSGVTLPLTLERTEKPPVVRRPQEPSKPYPYRELEVRFENKKAGVKLAGTLTLPAGKPPFPAVMLITGSGAQDRNETVAGHRPFLVLADYLTRRGIAVLRTDDRGVGGSTGDLKQATSADLAQDVIEGIRLLRLRKDIDRSRIGLIGHSEGALIAPMVASQSSAVSFIVLLAAPALPGEQILALQTALIARGMGASPQDVDRVLKINQRFFDIVKKHKVSAETELELQQALKHVAESLSEEERKQFEQSGVQTQVSMLTTPWFRFFLTYDPRPTLHRVKCAVLAIYGEKDLQVPPKENAPALREALRIGGNKQVTVRVMPGLNHLFQHCQTGLPTEYARIEETIAPQVLQLIAEWIRQRKASKGY